MTRPEEATLLWILLALFFLRVAGQVVVVLRHPTWLPPMREWYSGLIAYPALLPIQVVLLALMTVIAIQVSIGEGVFAQAHESVGRVLLVLSLVYAAGMAARYGLRMARHPDQRWFGGTIPIVFHIVLAAYLFGLARVQLGR